MFLIFKCALIFTSLHPIGILNGFFRFKFRNISIHYHHHCDFCILILSYHTIMVTLSFSLRLLRTSFLYKQISWESSGIPQAGKAYSDWQHPGGFYRGAFSLRPTWRMSDSQAAATSKSSTSHIKLPLWLCTGGGNEGGGVIWRGQRGQDI